MRVRARATLCAQRVVVSDSRQRWPVREHRHTEVGGGALHLGELLFGSGEAGPQAVDFAEPAALGGFGDPIFQAVDDRLESFVLVGVGAEHGAADAGVFVAAWGGVWAAAAAEFDFAFVEVRFELCPFVVGDGWVFLWWAECAAALEVGLVVAGDVFVEDGDVTAGGFEVEVPEQGCADVDG